MMKRKVKAVMVVQNIDLDVLATLTIHSLQNSVANRLIVESYIEQCSTFIDVQELETALKSFYGRDCYISVRMEIK